MLHRRWFRPEPEPNEGGLIGFRRQVLLFLAVFTFYGAWLLFLWVPDTRMATTRETAVAGLGLALAAATYLLRGGWPRLASQLYILGSMALTALVYLVFRQMVAVSLLALSTIAAGLLLGPRLAPIAGLAGAVLVVRLYPNALLSEVPPFWLVLIAAAAGLGILTGRALELVDYWEREATQRQGELIKQLRDRQGELNRTLKALDEAYESLKRSNDELRVARQAAEEGRVLKEQFVANVSHELRTPLNLIVGFAEIMYLAPESYDGVGWTPDLESDIREMYRAARHLQSLIDDILDLSRIDAARLPMFREMVDARTVIGEALETISPLLRQRRLSHSVAWPETLPELFIDRTRIRQVMLNLLNNAVRFTDRGGITIGVEQKADAVVVGVADTGVGVPPDQLEHIFEEFRQAQPHGRGGAGLGLAISRRFVELHGGRMWAESVVGAGSTFFFFLPLPGARPETTELYRIPERRRPDVTDAPVIVVDPDPNVAAMLGRYLGDRRPVPAMDAAAAEAMVETHHPVAVIVNQPPDAPVQAWLGPLGEKSERYHVPIVRCSLPSASWLEQSAGIDRCLVKPVSREQLSAVLAEHWAKPARILVVDDDPGFLSLMARMLHSLQPEAEVVTARSGARALRLAQASVPGLVLLDLLMPEMDGLEVLRALRDDVALCHTPVILVTATSYAEDALRRLGTQVTLSQSGGIGAGRLIEALNALLGAVRPDYV